MNFLTVFLKISKFLYSFKVFSTIFFLLWKFVAWNEEKPEICKKNYKLTLILFHFLWKICVNHSYKKNGEALESFMWTFSKKVPRVSDGFGILVWWVISSAHNLTVVQTVRSKLHTTLNNICTVLTLTGIELGTPKSLNIQSVMLTFPLHHRGTQLNILLLNCL